MTKDEALTMCLEYIETDAHERKYVRHAIKAALEQQAEPCTGKDSRCPCQDGDACHYKDCKATKAWPVPQAEPVSCRFCHDKKGCWAWQCYKCGEIDDVQKPTPPAAQRQWQGLTEEDFVAINQSCLTKLQAAGSAESILKERNK